MAYHERREKYYRGCILEHINRHTLETIPRRSTVVIGQWQKVVTSTFQQICVLLKFFMINNTYH